MTFGYTLLATGASAQSIADTYRQAANSYRSAAAQTTGQRQACYLQWANYYDCLASQLGANSSNRCPEPTCDSSANGGGSSVINPRVQRVLDRAARIARENANTQKAIQGGFKGLGNILGQGLQQQQAREQAKQDAQRQEKQARDAAELSQSLQENDSQLAKWRQLQAQEPSDAPVPEEAQQPSPPIDQAKHEPLSNLLNADPADIPSGSTAGTTSVAGNDGATQGGHLETPPTPTSGNPLTPGTEPDPNRGPSAITDVTEAQNRTASTDSSQTPPQPTASQTAPSPAEINWRANLSAPVDASLQRIMAGAEQRARDEAAAEEAQDEGIEIPSERASGRGSDSDNQSLYQRAKERAMNWAKDKIEKLKQAVSISGKPVSEMTEDDKEMAGALKDVGTHAVGVYKTNPFLALAKSDRVKDVVSDVQGGASQAVGGGEALIQRTSKEIKKASDSDKPDN